LDELAELLEELDVLDDLDELLVELDELEELEELWLDAELELLLLTTTRYCLISISTL
jgi:hypothetical protein